MSGGTQTNITNYVDTTVSNNLTQKYTIVLSSAYCNVNSDDKLNVNIEGYVQYLNGSELSKVSVSSVGSLTAKDNSNYTYSVSQQSGNTFKISATRADYSAMSTKPLYLTLTLTDSNSVEQDRKTVPVTFDAYSVFTVTNNAITAAVSQSNAYTDGSILAVNNRIADVSLTANGLVSTVQSHTTSINTLNGSVGTLNSSVSQIAQTADSISTRVSAIEDGNYVSQSTLTQTANQIKAEINSSLGSTGIDITNAQITLSAANTYINGNLNLYDSANNGLTIYDDSSIARVNIQSDGIDSVSQIAQNDTYNYYTLSASGTISSYDMTTSVRQENWTAQTTVDFDKFAITLYGNNGSSNVFPTASTCTMYLHITQPGGTVFQETITLYRQDSYGRYTNLDKKVRFTVKNGGIHNIKYRVVNSTSISGSITGYLNVSSRWQSASSVQTFIGRDGLYCHAGANKLIWSSESELQLRHGFNGIRWNNADSFGNRSMEVVTGVKSTSPNYKPVWLPFYNYVPTFSVGTGTTPYLFESQYIGNISETKYAFRVDPYRDRGICIVQSGYMDSNFNEQESWIVLPPSTFTDSDGNTVGLPTGYTITVINWTGTNIYVVPYSSSNHGAVIIDANRNNNWYADLNGTQSRDTYIFVGNWSGTGATWLSMHDTQ